MQRGKSQTSLKEASAGNLYEKFSSTSTMVDMGVPILVSISY